MAVAVRESARITVAQSETVSESQMVARTDTVSNSQAVAWPRQVTDADAVGECRADTVSPPVNDRAAH